MCKDIKIFEKVLELVRRGGAIVLAGLLVFVLGYVIWGYQQDAQETNILIGNHFDHNTKAINSQTEAMINFTREIEKLNNLIEIKL